MSMSTHQPTSGTTSETKPPEPIPGVSADELLELIAQGHDASDLSTLIDESYQRRAAA